MDPRAVSLIRSHLAAIAANPEGFAADYFARLFELAPSLRPLFGADLDAQSTKLAAMLDFVGRSLDRADLLTEPVSALGRRHAAYGVRSEDYVVVGHALLDTLEQRMPDFTEAARAAWAEAFVLLTDLMTTDLG
ncbi:globin domain-containing protein [Methylobacterium nodulans]|uniref:Globin n=1 Tax=Methylobacterium nodulans (strain LMG 21967 / CNCM I-2342 / ORS 2060) TaxID=460265 RepID=B8IIC7_METNO|nr:globin domain-containing protein [Methylobacterium nodulans]ACL57996.1 globin [Methylobacterium nodulans ORS 2060]